MRKRLLLALGVVLLAPFGGTARDFNAIVVESIGKMPESGTYARYRKDLPESRRFDDLHQTVADLGGSLQVGVGGALKVNAEAASRYSFCSSATYLLFCDVIARLQREGVVPKDRKLSRALADVGDKEQVIQGKLDGVGIFGHWNANGPGTAVLFRRLDLGTNFSSFERAKPGDFLKIFWNDSIGKGERGHLVVYLGTNDSGDAIRVWSSNMENGDGSAGYGEMWVKRERIRRALFSRLERPENLIRWLSFSEPEQTSDYLVRILQSPSSGEEMKAVTGAID